MGKQLEDSVELRSQLEDLRVEGWGDADGGADRGDDCGRGMLCCVQSHTRESVTGQRFTHRSPIASPKDASVDSNQT